MKDFWTKPQFRDKIKGIEVGCGLPGFHGITETVCVDGGATMQ